jgi:hypothetical protein
MEQDHGEVHGSPDPQNGQLLFIDQQPQMAFGVQSIDRQVLKNNERSARHSSRHRTE